MDKRRLTKEVVHPELFGRNGLKDFIKIVKDSGMDKERVTDTFNYISYNLAKVKEEIDIAYPENYHDDMFCPILRKIITTLKLLKYSEEEVIEFICHLNKKPFLYETISSTYAMVALKSSEVADI